MFGWHPGFNLWGDAAIEDYTLDFGDVNCLTHHVTNEMKFLSGAMEAFPLTDGKYKLCEAEIYEQDALIFTESLGKVTLTEPKRERAVTVAWSENLPYVAFWKWARSDIRYLCVEPWSGVPGDGVTPEVWEERKNLTVGSGDSESFVYTIKCE
jgi:galactose mutarotase-like enzyme